MEGLWHAADELGIVENVAAELGEQAGGANPGRDALVLGNQDLIDRVAAQLRASGIRVDVDELRGFGQQGLLEAADRYAADRGTDFRTFAYYRVRGAMLDGLRKMGSWSRRGYESVQLLRAVHNAGESALEEEGATQHLSPDEAASRLQRHMGRVVAAMTLGVFAEAAFEGGVPIARDVSQPADEALEEKQLIQLLHTALDELPAEEAEVLRRFYLAGQCLDEVAASLGCSRSWASRLHTRAIHRLGIRVRAAV